MVMEALISPNWSSENGFDKRYALANRWATKIVQENSMKQATRPVTVDPAIRAGRPTLEYRNPVSNRIPMQTIIATMYTNTDKAQAYMYLLLLRPMCLMIDLKSKADFREDFTVDRMSASGRKADMASINSASKGHMYMFSIVPAVARFISMINRPTMGDE